MSNTCRFRFYEELNDFLPSRKRKQQFEYGFSGKPSIKDAIEAIGVPHTEIDLIIVDGASVGFDYRLRNNDVVSVYPMFEALDITPLLHLREAPLREPKFICDVHLGTLARLLRLAGFDTLYRNDYGDELIVEIALAENRCILTRDRGILKRKAVTHGYCLRSTDPEQQIREVLGRFDLYSSMKPFTLCIECGGAISRVDKASVASALPEKTRECYDEFFQCGRCGKVFWQGSHFPNLQKTINALMRDRGPGNVPP
ncbi:MAG TPA: Mut7-C RNAse domain-containing protein [Chitinivibrionales bacterium]|nr:Mut7-C RNAse domain-containing protein [Chitinivibrionales bacterium]